uniref:RING-type E3 ubiquitin transferase n=1 Tax=Solanum tuberosum TaxID=4113 RepID=M1BI00_SOLTU
MEVASELIPSLEGLAPIEARSMIFIHILRFAISILPLEDVRNIVTVVDTTNNSIPFFEGNPINAEPILEGLSPASTASIEAIPMVKVLGEGIDCSICLSNFETGKEAKEMPCKHHFHSICIDKWLGINGSCPICRYKMPVDEQCEKKDEENGEDERGDDGSSDMSEDRVMLVFHVIITPVTTHQLTISIIGMHRNSTDMLMEVRMHRDSEVSESRGGDVFEARNGDVSEAGENGDVSEAGNGDVSGNGDEFKARDGDVSKAGDGRDGRYGDASEARDGGDGDVSEARDGGDDGESEAQDVVIDDN